MCLCVCARVRACVCLSLCMCVRITENNEYHYIIVVITILKMTGGMLVMVALGWLAVTPSLVYKSHDTYYNDSPLAVFMRIDYGIM